MPDAARYPEPRVQPVYLDYAATTPVDPRVARRMLPYMTQIFGNPASRSHAFGWAADEAVELAREQVASLVNADPREIVWTSGATESDNLALKGAAHFHRSRGKHLVTLATEHKAVLDTMRELEREGFEVSVLPVQQNGLVDPAAFEAALRPETAPCGDVMRLQIRINGQGVIEDARFKTYGCGSASASSSLVTEWVKGKTLDEAMAIRNTQIAEALALPPVKIHCSILAEDAIKAAVADFRARRLAAEPRETAARDSVEFTTEQPACASGTN